MVGTFRRLDYRLRPAKHAERTMLIDIFRRLRFAPIESYSYVGFGSVAFVDFRMVHRYLGITDLTSIEDVDDEQEKLRFQRNKPIRHLALRFGHSRVVLPAMNHKRRSIVWLDYDDALSRSMANDIATVARDAVSGTFIAATFTLAFPLDPAGASAQLGRLKGEFSEFLGDDASALQFQNEDRHGEFGRNALGALLERELANADAGVQDPLERRCAFQVCYFRYSDGQPMATVGWVVVSERDLALFTACEMDALPFVRSDKEPFRIRVPKVTPLELREMERRLPRPDQMRNLDWIPLRERRIFADMHRYLPNFGVFEPV